MDTLKKITLVKLNKIGLPQIEIRILQKFAKTLISKFANYDKRQHKKEADLKNSLWAILKYYLYDILRKINGN